jgi:hypothetical protein
VLVDELLSLELLVAILNITLVDLSLIQNSSMRIGILLLPILQNNIIKR